MIRPVRFDLHRREPEDRLRRKSGMAVQSAPVNAMLFGAPPKMQIFCRSAAGGSSLRGWRELLSHLHKIHLPVILKPATEECVS